MKYGFSIFNLLTILGLSLCVQHVFSQEMFDPASLFNSSSGLPMGIEEQITVTQIPNIPQPGETVSIQISGYSTNLNSANITWNLNGNVVSSGIGVTSFSFSAPQGGATASIRVTVDKEEGGSFSKTLTISPADVDLLYEAQTYVHPLYKGKRQFTSEADIHIVAVPHFIRSNGQRIPDTDLIYTWKINGSVQQAVSGYGRNIFVTKGSLIERASQITVEVSARNSTLKATQSINLQSSAPEVLIYENNPILGVMYETAVNKTFKLERPEIDFEAIPYFFSADYKDDIALSYSWFINNTPVTSKEPRENYLVLRNDNNEEGRAIISVSLNHQNNILQNSKSSLELNFEKLTNALNEQFTF